MNMYDMRYILLLEFMKIFRYDKIVLVFKMLKLPII